MLTTIKSILSEHNLSDQGGGNSYVASGIEPISNNFEGKIWYNTSTGMHNFYYDGRYVPLSKFEVYGGTSRKMKTDDGTFEIVEKLNENGNVIHRSTLSEPDGDGNFKNRKVESNIGSSNSRIDNYEIIYDEDGDWISEKKK